MLSVLQTEEDCRNYFEFVLWNDNPVCGHCKSNAVPYKLKESGAFKGLYKCRDCKMRFNVKTGTILEGTRTALRNWVIAIFLVSTHKKGITSLHLEQDLGVTQSTAWYMLQRIRSGLGDKSNRLMSGIVLSDETFVGGKNINRHRDKKVPHSQGRAFIDKTPVLGLMEKEESFITERPHKVIPELTVKEKHVLKPSHIRCFVTTDTSRFSIQPIVHKQVLFGSTFVSDEWTGYAGLNNAYHHEVVDHGRKQYVNENGFTTNPLEGAWKNFKGAIKHTHHQVSRKHLQKYADDFTHRHNTRNMNPVGRFENIIQNIGPRLKYKTLIQKL